MGYSDDIFLIIKSVSFLTPQKTARFKKKYTFNHEPILIQLSLNANIVKTQLFLKYIKKI